MRETKIGLNKISNKKGIRCSPLENNENKITNQIKQLDDRSRLIDVKFYRVGAFKNDLVYILCYDNEMLNEKKGKI